MFLMSPSEVPVSKQLFSLAGTIVIVLLLQLFQVLVRLFQSCLSDWVSAQHLGAAAMLVLVLSHEVQHSDRVLGGVARRARDLLSQCICLYARAPI